MGVRTRRGRGLGGLQKINHSLKITEINIDSPVMYRSIALSFFGEVNEGAMNPMMTLCPVCGERLAVTRLHCRACQTSIDGQFDPGRLGRLSTDQLAFVETFVRCEGKLNRMERELGLSYPTLRSRLTDLIRQMGYPVGPESSTLSDEERTRVLDQLATGEIDSAEAMRRLEGEAA